MSWKQLCLSFKHARTVERHRGWKAILQRCAIFDVRGADDAVLHNEHGSSAFDDEAISPLPFPETAIVHDWQTIVLHDFFVDKQAMAVGGQILALGIPFAEHNRDYWEIVTGHVVVDLSTTERKRNCTNVSRTYLLTEVPYSHDEIQRMKLQNEKKSDDAEVLETFFFNGLNFLCYINAPARFMVCETPKKIPKPKRDAIARIGQRPRYIVLDKEAIAKRYAESQPSGRRSPLPHLRRGHYRTLAADRFRDKKGQRVWVRATNVAGNEVQWREGDRTYKVL